MPAMNEQDAQNGKALLDTLLKHAPSYQSTVLNAVDNKVARNTIDKESEALYASALEEMPQSMLDLENPLKYAAWCIRCMKHETKSRTKINMIMHIGKVFGHDKRTLEVKDVTSVRDIVRRFQQEFKDKAVVEGRAVVKEIGDGRAATG